MSDLRDQVRDRYAAAATAVAGGTSACCAESAESAADASCCAPEGVAVEEGFGAELYSSDERAELPAEAVLASLGCGNPLAVADLQAGEVVLDLGSGGGIDVLLSARRVGPEGKAYGLDMTEEMLALARTNAAKAGATNVSVTPPHQAADGMHAAIIRATKPTDASAGTQQKETRRPSLLTRPPPAAAP